MEDLKRWIVTYTKHIKQKRKVYQDGFLELHTSTNKAGHFFLVSLVLSVFEILIKALLGEIVLQAKLYDDCEKLLDSRTLKQCEVVGCGETLTFNAYLVDIGEPNRAHKADLNSHENDAAFTEKSGSAVRRESSIKKEPRLTPSPSQKIIREFKRRLHNYGSPQSSQPENKLRVAGVNDVADAKSPTIIEWQILYTTQLTQKAKRYHDGFLSVALCSTLARKAKLYDASRTLLDSRFLRQSELINSGETMSFESHFVEIGDPVEQEESMNLNKSYGHAVDKQLMIYKHQESLEARNEIMKGKCLGNVGPGKYSSNHCLYTGEEIKTSGANKPLRDSLDILSILRKPMPYVTFASCDISETIATAPSFCKEPEASEAPGAVILDLREDDQSLTQVFKIQVSGKYAKVDPEGKEKTTLIEQSTTKRCVIEETKKGVEELKHERETNECPSFDLGF